MAHKEGIKYILNGHSFRTEGTSPISWTYMDSLYVNNVHKKLGKIKKFKSFLHMSLAKRNIPIAIKPFMRNLSNKRNEFKSPFFLSNNFIEQVLDLDNLDISKYVDIGKLKHSEMIYRALTLEYFFNKI